MTDRRRTAAQYLNGLAVAVIATGGSAALTGGLPLEYLILAAVMSGALHGLATVISP